MSAWKTMEAAINGASTAQETSTAFAMLDSISTQKTAQQDSKYPKVKRD